MIKECKVLVNNGAVSVVDYDGKHIQFPALPSNTKTVFVKCESGKYHICDGEEEEKKTIKKKTTPAAKPAEETKPAEEVMPECEASETPADETITEATESAEIVS